ncbi:MAG: amidohydrolase family protein [Deltaproteobacteria bacterium]|nr:amidohydrolase family protein [Deltaproteobacteria bacterium]
MIRLALLALLLAIVGCNPAATTPPASAPVPSGPAPVTALVGATVIDATGAPPIADAVVLLRNDRIASVGPRAATAVPPDAVVIDASGRWIVPGLIDAHVHFFQSGGLYTRPDIVDLRSHRPYESEYGAIQQRIDDTFKRYLVNGVTAVVDVGGPFWNFEVRDKALHTLRAPRVAVAGPLVSTVARPQFDARDLPILRADSADHARTLVRAQLVRKPDLIKLWGVVTPDRPPEDLPAIMGAAIEEAHAGHVRVAVHATEQETARLAARLGADILVHGVTDKEVDDDFVALLKDKGIVTIPTLVVYQGYGGVLSGQPVLSEQGAKYGDPRVIETWSELPRVQDAAAAAAGAKRKQRMEATLPIVAANVRKLHLAGAPLAAGTDAGNIGTLPGASLHDELGAMVRAGMSPQAVLIAATRTAARVVQTDPAMGSLSPGKLADLLVIDGDPTADIRNLQRIVYVVKGGVVLRQDDILPPNPTWVIDRQLQAYNARDIEGFLAWYTDDIVIAEHPTGKVLMSGKEQMRATYGKLFGANPRLHCTLLSRAPVGNMIVDHELVTGIEGRPYFHGAAIYEVAQGRIRRVWFLPKP